MDTDFTDTQIMFRNMARDFAEREIKPVALEYDRKEDPKEAVPLELFTKGFDQDFHKMVIPVKYGGMGIDAVTNTLMIEELAAGDPGFALIWHVNNLAVSLLCNAGTEDQIAEFIKPLMEPEPGIGAAATTEPNNGVLSATLVDPINFIFETTAISDGDELIINGDKSFCSFAGTPFTRWIRIYCRTDMTRTGWPSTSAVIIPTNVPGFKLVGEEDKMGHRLSTTHAMKFNNIRIPKRNLLAGGTKTVTFEYYSSMAAIAIGCVRSAYEAAIEYAKQRTVLGTPIIRYELIQSKIADMYIGLEAARSLALRAANYADFHDTMDMKLARAAKIFSSEIANKVAYDAMQIFGGSGYSKGTITEKCYRDVRVTTLYAGTNEVLRINLSQLIENDT